MSFLGVVATQSASGGTVSSTPSIPDPPPSEDSGENILINSVLDGETSTAAGSWTLNGDVTYIAGNDDDRYAQFVSADATRADIRQFVTLTAGQIATISFKCIAVDDATDGARSASFTVGGNLTAIDAKPTIGQLVAGTRYSWRVQATATSEFSVAFGGGVGTTAFDITLGQFMVDINDGLRAYDPTQPITTPDPLPDTSLKTLPHFGWGMGSPGAWGEALWNLFLRSGWHGFWFKAPFTGTISVIAFQLRSNNGPSGETSKSRVAGATPHGPYTWAFRVSGYDSNAAADAVGSATWSIDDTLTNSKTSSLESGPIRRFEPAGGWAVTEGNYYFVRVENREGSPDATYFSLNGTSARPATMGRTPPRQVNPSPALGDWPIIITGSSATSMAPFNRGIGGSFGCIYDDGVEYGTTALDATASTWRASIYGSVQVRQTYRYPKWAAASGLWNGAWRSIGQTPAGPLLLSIVGPGVNWSFSVAASNVPQFDPVNWTLPPVRELIEFAEDLIIQPNQDYILTARSPASSASAPFYWGCTRHTQVEDTPYDDPHIQTQHQPGGDAERSTNGGSTWLPIGYNSAPYGCLNSFISFGNQRVADSEDGL